MHSRIALIVTTVLLLWVASTSASDLALDLGDYLFSLQSYDEAITEYKRFLFFHPDNLQASDVLYKIGLAYRSEGRWPEAIEAIKTAIQQTKNAELRSERRIDLAVTLIASGNYNLALVELIKISTQNPSDRLHQRTLFLQGVAYLYMFNWESARQAFKGYFDAIPASPHKAEVIEALFEEAIHCPQKSVTVAKILSTILPGSGQTYAGDWKNGLNALALNGLLGFATIDAAIDNRYQDATFLALFLFLRYYMGNRYRAGEAAKQFNDRLNRQYAVNILQALSSQIRNEE